MLTTSSQCCCSSTTIHLRPEIMKSKVIKMLHLKLLCILAFDFCCSGHFVKYCLKSVEESSSVHVESWMTRLNEDARSMSVIQEMANIPVLIIHPWTTPTTNLWWRNTHLDLIVNCMCTVLLLMHQKHKEQHRNLQWSQAATEFDACKKP